MRHLGYGLFCRLLTILPLALVAASCSGTLAGGLAEGSANSATSPNREVRGWVTTADGARLFAPLEVTSILPPAGQSVDVVVDTAGRFQPFSGYGASITDATAWLLRHRMDDAARSQLLQELFSEGGDLSLDLTRITIGASDFSQSRYTYADKVGQAKADIGPARVDLIPTLQEIRAINPGLTVVASPWSAPAWMKTSNSLIKGRLDPAHYGDFAQYLVSYALEMKQAGVPIDMLTIQNEPHFEPEDYPGMRVAPSERASFVGGHLGPLMERDLPNTRLLDWDHNWNEPESPLAVLADNVASPFIDGVAWHCYAGDVSAQSLVHDRFPDKETWFTECSAGDWSGEWSAAFQWSAKMLVIGAPRNWARGVVMWNLALDQDNGPHLGGCGNCRGLITIDARDGTITREPEYYAFAHGSRFLPRNAVRIESTSRLQGIETVAFLGKDDGVVELIVYNGSGEDRAISISGNGRTFKADLPGGSLATFVIQALTH